MKSNTLFWCIVSFLFYAKGIGQSLVFESNFHSASYTIHMPASFDQNENATCTIKYRNVKSGEWFTAFPALRKGKDTYRFTGSLFNLEPHTTYPLDILITDPEDGFRFHTTSYEVTTRKEPQIIQTAIVKWISPNGNGQLFTKSNPGSWSGLLQTDLECGTTIFLKGGTYTIGSLQIFLKFPCTEHTPIQIIAAPGETVVFDGSYDLPLNWTVSNVDSSLYTAALPASCAYTNLCLLGEKRLYPYFDLINNGFNLYTLRDLNLNDFGFVRNDVFIHVKTKPGINPSKSQIILSREHRAMTIKGFGDTYFLRIQGLHFKNYAKTIVADVINGIFYSGAALDIRSCKEVLITDCSFEYCEYPIYCSGLAENFCIQNCRFKDQTGFFSHAMVKKSNDYFPFQTTSYGRNVENAAILFQSSQVKNAVIRGNTFGGCSTAVFFSDGDGSENCDIYENSIEYSFDGIEADGQQEHLKIWKNSIGHCLASISLAPPMLGPVYVFRNVFHHIISRENRQDPRNPDPYVTLCEPVNNTFWSQGLGIKTNSGDTVTDPSHLYFINNTFHTEDSLSFIQFMWDSEWNKIEFVNNIFYSQSRFLFFINGLLNRQDFQFSSDHNSYFCEQGPLFMFKEIHGQYQCHAFDDLALIQQEISDLTRSPFVLFTNDVYHRPSFKSIELGDFSLHSNDLLIDRGIPVDGFYNFNGTSPDIGAIESNVTKTSEVKTEPSISLYPNPTQGKLWIDCTDNLQLYSIEILFIDGRIVCPAFVRISESKYVISMPSSLSDGLYWLRFSTPYKTFYQSFSVLR